MVSGISFQQTRDNLGRPDDTRDPVLVSTFNENIIDEEGATYLKVRNIGDAFVVGHTTNGILGTANGEGGTQITLGEGKIGATTIDIVVNPNNIFHEHFRFDDFDDSSTANFSTTNFTVNITEEESFQTLAIFKNDESIVSVTPNIEISGGKTIFTATGTSKTTNITEGKNQFD